MKLDRLTSTTQHLSQNAREHARHVAAESIAQVGAIEGIEGDRQRSLQQEIAEFDQRALGPFAGAGQIQAAAHEIAVQLVTLSGNAHSLVKTVGVDPLRQSVDAKA